jgi:hypothetical protein
LSLTTVAHTVISALAAVELVRAIHQPWLRGEIGDERLVFAWAIVLPIASAAASLLAIWRGNWRSRSERERSWPGRADRALAADVLALAVVFGAVLLLSLGGPVPSEAVIALLAVALAARVAAAVVASVDVALPDIAMPTPAFLAMNAVLIALLVLWPLPADCELGCSMRARWVPFGLALATALTLALSWRSTSVYRRHALFWLAVPVAFALTSWSAQPQTLVGIPIVALAVGIAVQGLRAIFETLDARSDRAIGALLGLTVVATSLALLPWVRTVQPTESDEPHYLIASESLTRDGDLDLRDEYEDPDYFDYYPTRFVEPPIIDVGDRKMPIRDPGLPVLGAIPFLIGRRTGVLILMCAVVAAFAWRGYALLRVLEFRRQTALLAAALVSLVHPLFTYTTQVYPDPVGALVAILVAEQLARPVTAGRLAIASLLLGVLPWLSVRHWFVAIGMGLVVAGLALLPLVRGRVRVAVPLALAGALPFVALVGAYALFGGLLYGVPVPNPGYFVIRDQQVVAAYTPWIGVPGLLLDRTFGLLSHAPIYALAFLGAVPLLRRWRVTRSPAILALFLGWLLYFVYVADIFYWWADGSPSSRYLLASIGFLLLAVAAGLEVLRSHVSRLIAWAAFAWSIAVTIVYALIPNIRYDIAADVRPDGGPGFLWVIVTHALRADPALLFPSMVRGAPQDYALAAAWMLAFAGLAVAGARARSGSATAAYNRGGSP